MPKIVLWSPVPAKVGQTHAAIALATLMAIEEDYSNLLIYSQWLSNKISSSYEDYYTLKSKGVFGNSSMGITALTRLGESNKLTPESIRNYSKPILKQRLDTMYGLNAVTRDQYQDLVKNFPGIVQKANEAYDIVWIDSSKGMEREYIRETLKKADLVICTLCQDIAILDEAIKEINSNEILKEKHKILLMCDYEAKSRYNIPNIRRRFAIKEPILCIPRNYVFVDCCNDGDVVEGFFYKNLNAEAKEYNGYFISEVRKVIQQILGYIKV